MSVLVDSSIWIDHLRGVRTRETRILGTLLDGLDPGSEQAGDGALPHLLIGDLILCEVLRGIPDPREHAVVKDALLKATRALGSTAGQGRLTCMTYSLATPARTTIEPQDWLKLSKAVAGVSSGTSEFRLVGRGETQLGRHLQVPNA